MTNSTCANCGDPIPAYLLTCPVCGWQARPLVLARPAEVVEPVEVCASDGDRLAGHFWAGEASGSPTPIELYRAAIDADKAWQAELERQFGKDAGTIRYTVEGRTGPILESLHAEARRAGDAWMAHMRQAQEADYAQWSAERLSASLVLPSAPQSAVTIGTAPATPSHQSAGQASAQAGVQPVAPALPFTRAPEHDVPIGEAWRCPTGDIFWTEIGHRPISCPVCDGNTAGAAFQPTAPTDTLRRRALALLDAWKESGVATEMDAALAQLDRALNPPARTLSQICGEALAHEYCKAPGPFLEKFDTFGAPRQAAVTHAVAAYLGCDAGAVDELWVESRVKLSCSF